MMKYLLLLVTLISFSSYSQINPFIGLSMDAGRLAFDHPYDSRIDYEIPLDLKFGALGGISFELEKYDARVLVEGFIGVGATMFSNGELINDFDEIYANDSWVENDVVLSRVRILAYKKIKETKKANHEIGGGLRCAFHINEHNEDIEVMGSTVETNRGFTEDPLDLTFSYNRSTHKWDFFINVNKNLGKDFFKKRIGVEGGLRFIIGDRTRYRPKDYNSCNSFFK
jgi:hypothetical protein